MVDLGFLLITFFMYTTTLARPMVMELEMPFKPPGLFTPRAIPAESTIILLPTSDHFIALYKGTDNPAESLEWCRFEGMNSLRSRLHSEAMRVRNLPSVFSKEAHQLHVLIKPDTSASYDDIVRTLDEMSIGAVPYYTIMRIAESEQAAIKKFSAHNYGK